MKRASSVVGKSYCRVKLGERLMKTYHINLLKKYLRRESEEVRVVRGHDIWGVIFEVVGHAIVE